MIWLSLSGSDPHRFGWRGDVKQGPASCCVVVSGSGSYRGHAITVRGVCGGQEQGLHLCRFGCFWRGVFGDGAGVCAMFWRARANREYCMRVEFKGTEGGVEVVGGCGGYVPKPPGARM